MMKKICLSGLLAMACIVAGCVQRSIEKEDLLAVEPNVAMLVIPGDYASGEIGATGGLQTWLKTVKLELDGVVTFYRIDKSFYVTEHHFEFYPWSNSIRISAQEPLGKFVWQLSNGRFSMPEGKNQDDVSSAALSYRDYTEAVLTILAAPVRFLDKSVSFVKKPTPVKKEGLWYYPIEMTYLMEPVQPYWPKVVFFQNKDNSLVEILWLADIEDPSRRRRAEPERDKFLAVRGYDYQKVEKNGVLVPTKIEIFRSDARAILKERLVKVDFKHRNPG